MDSDLLLTYTYRSVINWDSKAQLDVWSLQVDIYILGRTEATSDKTPRFSSFKLGSERDDTAADLDSVWSGANSIESGIGREIESVAVMADRDGRARFVVFFGELAVSSRWNNALTIADCWRACMIDASASRFPEMARSSMTSCDRSAVTVSALYSGIGNVRFWSSCWLM